MERGVRGLTIAVCLVLICGVVRAEEKYERGGPLAGLNLPLYKTQHGDPPGYPGCIPALIAKGREMKDVGVVYHEFGKQGLAPELELYPGAVEHWRAYWFKYCPVRGFFDRQSLLKNFVAPDIPGAQKAQLETYAEPVYWIPRHTGVKDTGRRSKPVPVIRCTVKSPVFQLDLGQLDPGLYAVRVIGVVEPKNLRHFLLPLYTRLRVNDGLKGETHEYRKPLTPGSQDARVKEAQQYIGGFHNDKYCGVAPPELEATFHLEKTRVQPGKIAQAGAEVFFMPRTVFDPQSPDKFTRLHLLGAEGALVMKGDLHCTAWLYDIPNLFVQRKGPNLQSAFAAVIEPYAGKPFVAAVKMLPVAGNETDARRAVALEVKTVNGHTDVCFADARPDKTRKVGALEFAGEFAYHSTDADGLRQCALTGGTLLSAPDVRIRAAVRERTGKVVAVDYLNKTIRIDQRWPARRGRNLIEIGTLPESGQDGYVTAYTATTVWPDQGGSVITFFRGADYYRSRIKDVDPKTGTVTCVLNPPASMGEMKGLDRNFTASDEQMTHFWRADIIPGDRSNSDYPFKLSGAPVTAEAFAPDEALRLWEYGVGDHVRQSTFVFLRRVAPGVYAVDGDVDLSLSLPGAALETSWDRRTWQKARATGQGGWSTIELPASRTLAGPLYVRIVK